MFNSFFGSPTHNNAFGLAAEQNSHKPCVFKNKNGYGVSSCEQSKQTPSVQFVQPRGHITHSGVDDDRLLR